MMEIENEMNEFQGIWHLDELKNCLYFLKRGENSPFLTTLSNV